MAKRAVTRSRTTLTGVAEAAGVSVATVSKVVNGRSDVSPETRARVEQLLVEHDYVARGPGGAQSPVRTIDLTFDALVNPNNLVIAQGVIQAAGEAGVDVVLGTAPDDPLGAAWARKITNAGREGVILVTSELSARQRAQFAQAGIPVVLIDPTNVPDESVPSIGATNFTGGMTATEHLLKLGHRRIAMIEGRHDAVCNTARLHGYQAALTGAGITPDTRLMKQGDFRFEPAHRAALELFALDDPPTAVFAGNDQSAFGVIEAARRHGLRVPEDLSVVGFDDTGAASTSAPPLTTVRQPFVEIGRAALRTLLRLTAGEPLDSHRVELATQLVVRSSTAPPPPSS
ncbi:LacI family DNA-binding transcriptional regulator [Streptomyces scabiei]|uniref:LacI family DNA-binding transcriptional regulator n=2 Tax=Streptomyces scabiei TaxID=1930 RepID=UPI0007660B78|nr:MULTISPECIES: LacI family DNA-binding transcriptional regulator [Streptomyces]MBP5872784.1 LacI family transcriptional regulator [Streptomyces sp. LBUM 1485]MBP5934138.1 LacI family transcriptional regulator [Streptomyces sp. LBUM 1479]MBP5910983.1 LacI family transcriptional regulator [Streptomyces sp. LBUM 1486]MDX2533033.1 LacI family DNA-binding transcriptional regulator [Streptomyces scabiei]MDX2859081.1 LacI family DNA-binding transcriptional regulator [Streptomyces scabiei]